jgi:hypothetical protein
MAEILDMKRCIHGLSLQVAELQHGQKEDEKRAVESDGNTRPRSLVHEDGAGEHAWQAEAKGREGRLKRHEHAGRESRLAGREVGVGEDDDLRRDAMEAALAPSDETKTALLPGMNACDAAAHDAPSSKPSVVHDKTQSSAAGKARRRVLRECRGGWLEIATEDGEVYYANRKTRESRWEAPPEAEACEEIEKHGRRQDHGDVTLPQGELQRQVDFIINSPSPSPLPPSPPLPSRHHRQPHMVGVDNAYQLRAQQARFLSTMRQRHGTSVSSSQSTREGLSTVDWRLSAPRPGPSRAELFESIRVVVDLHVSEGFNPERLLLVDLPRASSPQQALPEAQQTLALQPRKIHQGPGWDHFRSTRPQSLDPVALHQRGEMERSSSNTILSANSRTRSLAQTAIVVIQLTRDESGALGLELGRRTQGRVNRYFVSNLSTHGATAESGELLMGDEVLQVDALCVAPLGEAELARMMRGRPYTSVRLTLLRKTCSDEDGEQGVHGRSCPSPTSELLPADTGETSVPYREMFSPVLSACTPKKSISVN